jgi:hypothetical protein
VLTILGLTLYGLLRFPGTSTRSHLGAAIVLLVYGLVAWRAPVILFRQPRFVATIVISLGLVAGAALAGEVILEYVILPADNTIFGYVEFGLVFLLYFMAGAVVAYRDFPWRSRVLAGAGTAIIGSLLWYITVLACFYIFFGTEAQTQVFRAEGEYDDFRRSGMTDFPTFVMEDYFGAGFFHLVLGSLVAVGLASLGGLVGKGLARFRKA